MAVENKYKAKDEALFAEVQKLKDGSSGDYNRLYELSEKYIYKIINDIVKNHHTTEDIMQETYLQIYNKIDTLQEAKAFYVWAGRIATNLTLRHVQKYRKEVLATADEEGSTDFVFDYADEDNECFIPENVLMDKEKQRLIAEIIDSLSIEQKLSVQYFYYEEMSVRDIALTMGCSEGTVKSRLNYARKSIKDAVIDLDVKQGTRLYSLSTLPLFWLVFREGVELLVAAGGAVGATAAAGVAGAIGGTGSAGVAGGSVGAAGAIGGASGSAGVAGSIGSAGAAGGSVVASAGSMAAGTGSAAVGAGNVAVGTGSAAAGAGSVAASGSVAGAGSVAASGSAAGASATAGGSAVAAGTATTAKVAGGIGAKLLGTAVGKAVVGVVAAAVVVGGGATVYNSVSQPKPAVENNEVVEEKNRGQVTFYYSADPRKEDIWGECSGNILLFLQNDDGNYVINESSEAYEAPSDVMESLYVVMQEQTSLEEAKIFFEKHQHEAMEAEQKGENFSVDVTKEFPESLEFDFDGMHFTLDITSVLLDIEQYTYNGEYCANEKFYTAGYKKVKEDGDIRFHYAGEVSYYVLGYWTCDGDIMQSKYARDAEGNYMYGESQENMPVAVTEGENPTTENQTPAQSQEVAETKTFVKTETFIPRPGFSRDLREFYISKGIPEDQWESDITVWDVDSEMRMEDSATGDVITQSAEFEKNSAFFWTPSGEQVRIFAAAGETDLTNHLGGSRQLDVNGQTYYFEVSKVSCDVLDSQTETIITITYEGTYSADGTGTSSQSATMQQPVEVVAEETGEGMISLIFWAKPKQQDIWEGYNEKIYIKLKNSAGDIVVQETWSTSKSMMASLNAAIKEKVSLEDAKSLLEEHQKAAMEASANGKGYRVDVKSVFGDVLEFEYNGKQISFEINEAEAAILNQGFPVATNGDAKFYSDGYIGMLGDEEHYIYAGGVTYELTGSYSDLGEATSSQSSTDTPTPIETTAVTVPGVADVGTDVEALKKIEESMDVPSISIEQEEECLGQLLQDILKAEYFLSNMTEDEFYSLMAQVPCTISFSGEPDKTTTLEEFFKTDWTKEAAIVDIDFDTNLAFELVDNFKKVEW